MRACGGRAALSPPIYMDSHSTTPVDPRVMEEMLPYFGARFGNASSLDHSYGHEASEAVEGARGRVAGLVGARPEEIVFTGGATESNNIALAGCMDRYSKKGDHLITCATEHKAVLETARWLEGAGKRVTYLPVDMNGEIDLEGLEAAITDRTVMVSIMAANNEIGTISDLEAIGELAHKREVLFHTDAAQAVGHIPIDVNKMNVDLMSMSAHKMYGPKGTGALYVRGIMPRVHVSPMVHGGGQERNMRSGSLNVPGIVGFGTAAKIAKSEMDGEAKRLGSYRSQMLERLIDSAGATLNADPRNVLPHNLNVRFEGIEAKAIINSVSDTVAISASSACTTQSVDASHVLLAIGLSEQQAHSSVRIGLGKFNVDGDSVIVVDAITKAVQNLMCVMG